jgi:hypothetical protein
MTELTPIQYKPTVIKDDADYGATGAAIDSDKIRWVRGRPQSIGGWDKVGIRTLDGVCRGMYSYSTSNGDGYVIIGTHTKLYVFDGARSWDITPVRAYGALGTDPLTTTAGGGSGQTVSVSVADTAHGAIAGDTVYIFGASAFDNVPVGGSSGTLSNNPFTTIENSGLVTVSETAHGLSTGWITYYTGASAVGGITIGGTGSGSFGAAPYVTIEGSEIVTVTLSGHGLFTGETITISGGTAVNGITVAGDYVVAVIDANTFTITTDTQANADGSGGGTPTYAYERPYTVQVLDANNYMIEHPEKATSAANGGGASVSYEFWKPYVITGITDADTYSIDVVATGAQSGASGGGSAVEVKYELNVGLTDTIAGKGFGVGGYGTGGFGISVSALDELHARTWSMGSRGDYAYANAIGQTIHQWTAILSRRAAVLANAPARVQSISVTKEYALMAYGCTSNEEVFQPGLIRYSDSTNVDVWLPGVTNLAGDIPPIGGTLITSRPSRNGDLAWTDTSLYLITYSGQLDRLYEATRLGTGCGVAGPNAVVSDDGSAHWVSPQAAFFAYRGAAPVPLPNPNRRWFQDTLQIGQEWKIWAALDNAYKAVTWFFPTTSEGDCDTYLRWDIMEDPNGALGWSNGTFDRTAWLDRRELSNPLAVDVSGQLYFQEAGLGADGSAVTRYVQFAPIDTGSGTYQTTIKRLVFAIDDHQGVLTASMTCKDFPDGNSFSKGPHTIIPGNKYPAANSNVWDTMTQARQFALRLESTGASDFWRVSLRGDLGGGTKR